MGETGTGKELVARALHELSPRNKRALVKVNCAALPADLIESELFGREKGAFTGAATAQAGRFEVADGSTLFLDEIGELPVELQAKLLRVLDSGEFERLGSTRTRHSNARIIAATNRELEEEVKEKESKEMAESEVKEEDDDEDGDDDDDDAFERVNCLPSQPSSAS